jgi:Ca2+-binding RTX toxin-like protein
MTNLYLVLTGIVLILIGSEAGQAFANTMSYTIKSSVIIISTPPLCSTNISHFDNFIQGTKNNQMLVGTNKNDMITGFENSLIFGKAGNDCLVGGDGNNLLEGGPGNDVIIGGTGINVIFTGNGDNIVKGGSSDDLIFFGHGHNIIDGGSGKNYCIGNSSHSVITNCIVLSHSNGEHGSHDDDKIKEILSNVGFFQGKKHDIPSWMKTNLTWWNAGKISDDDLASEVLYLIRS